MYDFGIMVDREGPEITIARSSPRDVPALWGKDIARVERKSYRNAGKGVVRGDPSDPKASFVS